MGNRCFLEASLLASLLVLAACGSGSHSSREATPDDLQSPADELAVTPPTGNCYSQEGCTDYARGATAFWASVGINTHVGYGGTVYRSDWPMVRSRLIELGVSHVRDGTFAAGYADITQLVADRYNELNAAGIKGNLLVGHEQAVNGISLAARLDWIKTKVPGFTIAIEGSNEYDTFGGDPARVRSLRDMQCEIYNRVKGDPALASKPVVGPSTGAPFSLTQWYQWVGDLSGCMDNGNQHPYPGAQPPHRHQSRDLSVSMGWGETTFGAKPQWVTETGYWNNTGDANNVSEAASGIYIPRASMENFRRGIERTMLYELIDLRTGSGQVIDNYGLLRTDGTAKQAFVSLRNMLATVKDTAASSGSLKFGIVCHTNCKYGQPDVYPTQDGPIRHVLLKHSSGAYFLAVWSESKIWDEINKRDTPKPAQGFNLYLYDAPAKVEVFDPAVGTSPISTDTSGNTVIGTIATDGVRLIKITPGTAPPSSSTLTGMAFQAEGMTVTPTYPTVYPNPSSVQPDANASGGKYVKFNHYGTATQKIATSHTANRLVVRAKGDQCSAGDGWTAPQMTLKLDGVTIQSRAVNATSWTEYTFRIPTTTADEHTVSISYDNDAETGACNRNLYLDKGTFTFVAPPTTIEAEGMMVKQDYTWSSPTPGTVQNDSTAGGGQRLMLWTYGTASKSLTTSHAYKKVVIRVRGDQCAAAPEAWLQIDGVTVAKHVVQATTWASYSHTISIPAGQHTIAVQYPYDYQDASCDRNLYLDKVTLSE